MLPTLFISHGSPMLATEPGVYGHAWQEIARAMPRPAAILVISAHWTTAQAALTLADPPETIHDFGGFPPELYRLRYPAPGAPELARTAAALLADAGIEAGLAPARGLDHGAWVPLLHMYPEADIPVTQLSVQPGRDAAWHLRLGEALQPLPAQDVLLLASGSLTHNLRDFDFAEFSVDRAEPYVKDFQDWMLQALSSGDSARLADWQRQAPAALRAHPTPEHLLPLFVARGAAGMSPRVRRPLANYSGGALAMDCYLFDQKNS
ncbi:MAG: Extradiol ring-cleavage dioxygenase class protein subunit [Moraxellaceae bacterium]|nr:Extradiol ring-cleavage dioxygenase class protein subunit [Moraxellaceae bacterium]